MDSGIVTNASMHTFLKMFILCDKVRHVTKSNGVIHILSVLLSLFVAFFLTFHGRGRAAWPRVRRAFSGPLAHPHLADLAADLTRLGIIYKNSADYSPPECKKCNESHLNNPFRSYII